MARNGSNPSPGSDTCGCRHRRAHSIRWLRSLTILLFLLFVVPLTASAQESPIEFESVPTELVDDSNSVETDVETQVNDDLADDGSTDDPSDGSFEEDDAPTRRYRDGELVIGDFKMKPPGDREDLDAMVATQVRIHFDYRCEYGSRRLNGKAKANLTRLDVFAVMRPEESWMATKDDKRLIGHEQGHFDVAHIAAMSARLHMHQCWSDGGLVGRGDTPEEAIQKLRDNIQEEMKPFYEKLKTAQKKYDEITSHGRRFRAQRAQRELQQEYLTKLTEKWEESDWYKRQLRRDRYRRRRGRRPVLADNGDEVDDKDDEDGKESSKEESSDTTVESE